MLHLHGYEEGGILLLCLGSCLYNYRRCFEEVEFASDLPWNSEVKETSLPQPENSLWGLPAGSAEQHSHCSESQTRGGYKNL